MTSDMETPSIVVEPPRDEIEDLIDSGRLNSALGGEFHFNVFPDGSSNTRNTSAEQGLFSTPLENSPISSGQVSPLITTGLRDGAAKPHHWSSDLVGFDSDLPASSGNMFLSASGQNSPIDAWSPVSTSSGDLFPDAWSDCSSSWSPSVESSSPSSPSLSPINSSMNNIRLTEPTMLDENGMFNQGPSMYRMRSNSYSGGSDSPPESNNGRPRSASFTNPQVPGGSGLNAVPQVPQAYQWDPSYHDPMTAFLPGSPVPGSSLDNTLFIGNTGASYGSPSSSNFSSPSSDVWQFDLSAPIPSIMFQPPPGPPPQNPSSSANTHSRSLSTHLTVPSNTHSLQRRGAHRRSHSHTGVHEPPSPSSPSSSQMGRVHLSSTRGRSPGPSSARHSRPPSLTRDHTYSPVDPNAAFMNINPAVQLPTIMTDTSPFLSLSPPTPSSAAPSPTHSPISPAIEISAPDNSDVPVINVDDYDTAGLARRHSYGGSQSPEPPHPAELHRAASDPVGRGRKPRARTVPRRFPGLLRPQKEVDESMQLQDQASMMMDVPIEGITSTASSPTPASSDNEHKEIVASTKIVDASSKRRKKQGEKGRFVCTICGHDFTAKHNLNMALNRTNAVSVGKLLQQAVQQSDTNRIVAVVLLANGRSNV
ncbi:hypothetical protein VNI00_013606 [Paramarasmius palmivorus]|uniref:Uncharacterized protein n=1 Tax=Paramarasmius palmivorus TaxID=297713 RepID=A0AAW0BWE0_9AGAR